MHRESFFFTYKKIFRQISLYPKSLVNFKMKKLKVLFVAHLKVKFSNKANNSNNYLSNLTNQIWRDFADHVADSRRFYNMKIIANKCFIGHTNSNVYVLSNVSLKATS